MIKHLQNGIRLRIGPFEQLNWNTAALVCVYHFQSFNIHSFSLNFNFSLFAAIKPCLQVFYVSIQIKYLNIKY